MRTYYVLGFTESHNRCLGALVLGDLSTQDMPPPGIGSLDTEESLGESMRSRRSSSARSTASSAYDACRAVFVLRSMVCGVERRRKYRGVRGRFSVVTGSHCLMVYSVCIVLDCFFKLDAMDPLAGHEEKESCSRTREIVQDGIIGRRQLLREKRKDEG